jgi:hypothetical protein
MNPIHFCFCLHHHQPVGNFDPIFEEAYRQAYLPFLELLECFPSFRVSLHHTGPLLLWITKNKPEYLERLGNLVDSKQVELLGGAFYEAILPMIPERDRVGQIQLMSNWLERVFGVLPRGMWLAERVWEPGLPKTIREAGLEFLLLDDFHLLGAGIPKNQFNGYYTTESEGSLVNVFPIDAGLRQRIPYAETTEVLEFFKDLSRSGITLPLTVMGDDGEKFGVWPDSFWYCYREGWMYRFAELMTNNGNWLKMKTLSEVLDSTAPLGKVYIPSGSYPEMMEWSMPASTRLEYEEWRKALPAATDPYNDESRRYVRPGFWNGFLAKYTESNHLHKKMLRISRRYELLTEAQKKSRVGLLALDSLWQGQCNCGYWHGLFGGLYLTNIRHSLYNRLIQAESAINSLFHEGKSDWVSVTTEDFDADGSEEVFVQTGSQQLVIQPHAGGMLVEHDLTSLNFNLHDTLMRRFEPYHQELLAAQPSNNLRVKEPNLQNHLVEDLWRRGALIDHFFDARMEAEDFRLMTHQEAGDFVFSPYSCSWKEQKTKAVITLERLGAVHTDQGTHAVRLEKTLTIPAGKATVKVSYKVTNLSPHKLETRLGVESTVNLLTGSAHDRFHRISSGNSLKGAAFGNVVTEGDMSLGSVGQVPKVSQAVMVDEWQKLELIWKFQTPCTHWRFPIETVSNSESGLERIYQGTCVMFLFDLNLKAGEQREFEWDFTAVTE